MQISIDTAILERVFTHSTAAARLVGQLDGAIVVGPLTDHVNAIVHELSELLGDPAPCGEPYTRLGEALALRRRHAAPVPSADATFEHDAVTRNRLEGAGGAP